MASRIPPNPNRIRNRLKRQQVAERHKQLKRKFKSLQKRTLQHMNDDASDQIEHGITKIKQPRTIENTRQNDETIEQDEEVQETLDEFASYFQGQTPKILLTSGYNHSKVCFEFIRDLLHVFPNSFFYERKRFELKEIVKQATEKEFTDIVIVNENKKTLNGLTHVHLPDGPTAHYKLSSVVMHKDIPNHAAPTSQRPELILNNFDTRLGDRIGRMLGALFHQEPNFKGRRVATFHNQRDFIFFRQHRYIFDKNSNGETVARLQEIGPRFTLKLRWLMHGTFDTKHGEYEFIHNSDEKKSRTRFII